MRREAEIWMTPKQAADRSSWRGAFAHFLHIPVGKIRTINPIQRSIDARTQKVKIRVKAELFIDEKGPEVSPSFIKNYPDVSRKAPVIIVGAGPAGLFAALTLIQNNLRPIILERGKDVKARKFDIARLNREHIVNPDSNYCFGEGGAGTYSDGKLYTRSTKRGSVQEILSILVSHGADPDILIDSHPHIGTDKLPAIIQSMRQSIIDAGGEIHFNHRVHDLIIHKGKTTGVIDKSGNAFEGIAVIIATGHSAKDVYEILDRHAVGLEAKSFALGVRAEHPQELIDSIQYHHAPRDPYLPAASYSLVKQVEGRGVFSFCMCPGGIIVPSATETGQLVVNGMSNSKRNSPYANSGIVVAIEPADFAHLNEFGPFAGLEFQRRIEDACWRAGGMTQTAPAQRITDFVEGRVSSSLPVSSYFPGLRTSALHELLPPLVAGRLQQAFVMFDKQMKGYLSNEAVILGTESRTSSPIRIPRDPDTFEQLQIKRLFPCGEGAGYAGGIVSSAMDGVNCAKAIALINKS
ncbi:MAG: NAD(P)/FAD-dependent oxidoreductase [Bacteroidetes bacterium]|nr:NAD(P)/FAD-dependent oxidoreductase [Bacteroidota bacterium]